MHEGAHELWGATWDAPLDAVLAAARVSGTVAEPLWVIVIGAPSTGKTERLNVVLKALASEDVIALDKLTPASFITGARDEDGNYQDLLPILNGRLLVIRDLSPLLSMDGASRDSIVGDLRSIYDGSFTRNLGRRGLVTYNVHFGIAAACTPAWETYHAVIGTLGQRFLIVRIPDAERTMRPTDTPEERRAKLSRLSALVHQYLTAIGPIKESVLEDNGSSDRVWSAADYLARIRGIVPRDTNKMVMAEPIIEHPFRLYRQLSVLAASGGIHLAECIARDTAPRLRKRVLDTLNQGERTIDGVSAIANLARSPVERALEDLTMLGLVTEDSSTRPYRYAPLKAIPPQSGGDTQGKLT
jgi:hypothetical protein